MVRTDLRIHECFSLACQLCFWFIHHKIQAHFYSHKKPAIVVPYLEKSFLPSLLNVRSSFRSWCSFKRSFHCSMSISSFSRASSAFFNFLSFFRWPLSRCKTCTNDFIGPISRFPSDEPALPLPLLVEMVLSLRDRASGTRLLDRGRVCRASNSWR